MSEDRAGFDSLGAKAKSFDIAMQFTHGDEGKAKAMVSGQYNDIIALKGKFLVPDNDNSGMFLAFFNIIDEYIATILTAISPTTEVFDKLRVFDDWKSVFSDYKEFQGNSHMLDSNTFNDYLLDSFISRDVFPDVQDGKLNDLTTTVNEVLSQSFNVSFVQSQIELEQTSSLAMVEGGLVLDIPEDGDTDEGGEDTQVAVAENIYEKEADYVVDGKVIVSPVKGKYVNDIVEGEKIKVLLTGRDVVTQKILKVLNAYDEDGQILPINGRMKGKIPLEKSGYTLYALVAKGVLAKIVEEENVKIQVDRPEDKKNKTPQKDSRIMMIVALVVGILILCGIIIALVA